MIDWPGQDDIDRSRQLQSELVHDVRAQEVQPTMLGLDSFTLVVVGTFQVAEIDYGDFDFNGQRMAEQLRVPPLLRAGVGEYVLTLLPGRFEVAAGSSKATKHRVEPMRTAAKTFVNDYIGRRAVQQIGHNFVGNFQPRQSGSAEFLGKLISDDRFEAAAGPAAPILRRSVIVTWQLLPEARARVQLEPLQTDASKVFYNFNVQYGADVEPNVALQPLAVPAQDAIDSFDETYSLLSTFLEKLVSDGEGLTTS